MQDPVRKNVGIIAGYKWATLGIVLTRKVQVEEKYPRKSTKKETTCNGWRLKNQPSDFLLPIVQFAYIDLNGI